MIFQCGDLERALRTPELMPDARAHAENCQECRYQIYLWTEISRLAPQLHEEWESAQLWPRIRADLAAQPPQKRNPQPWRWVLAVAACDLNSEAEQFYTAKFITTASGLRDLSAWLLALGVGEVVMESTAQYWYPVWMALESQFRLHLAQAHSNAAPQGRKTDFADARRLVRRFGAQELRLSFVPEPEQREWRCLTRARHQLIRDRVRLQGHIESLLEEMQIKLSSFLSDLLGMSGRKILAAIAKGERDPEVLAKLAHWRVRATPAMLHDALNVTHLRDSHRRLLDFDLERLALIESQVNALDQDLDRCLLPCREAVERLTEIPGISQTAAHQIIAQVGPDARAFPSSAQLASWVGVCPGRTESAGVSRSDRSPKGNRPMRRVLTQVAHAAVKTKGSHFQKIFNNLIKRLGFSKAIWAVAHRLCKLIWKILHDNVHYSQPKKSSAEAERRRANRLLSQLRSMGFLVQISAPDQTLP